MAFGKHPSLVLQNLYKEKYWQCQSPQKAKVIFLSLDANWDEKIEGLPIFPEIIDYLNDGVTFWEKTGIHHPFLLPTYSKGDGYKFHKNFSKINLSSEYAKHISFIELLNVPTIGMSTRNKALYLSLLNLDYLKELESIIFDDREKIVFMPKKVYAYLKMISRKYGVFGSLMTPENTTGDEFINIYNKNNVFIFVCNHFSATNFNYFYENMGTIVRSFLREEATDIWWKIHFVSTSNGERIEKERFIRATNVIEAKRILCKHIDVYEVESDLKQLKICPVQQEDIKQELIWG